MGALQVFKPCFCPHTPRCSPDAQAQVPQPPGPWSQHLVSRHSAMAVLLEAAPALRSMVIT